MRAVPLKAVVFDFYGTLSVSATAATRRTGISRVASGLGVPEDLLYDAITSTFTERATGALGTLEQTMQWLAERCGATPTDEQLQAACALRRSIEAVYATALRPDAVPTLRALRERDIKIGVLSDCTHELPEIWPSLPIAGLVDFALFSVEAGLRKPHPDLYARVARSLDVLPRECLYVGDGGSSELTGALRAGMTPIHLRAPDSADALVYDAETSWRGPCISALSYVVDVLADASNGTDAGGGPSGVPPGPST